MKKQGNVMQALRSLGDRDFLRKMLPLAIPIVLQNLLASSFGMVDTIMVGKLGDVAIAAVGAAGQLTSFIGVVFYGVVSGGAVFIAQYWGNRNLRQIHRHYGLMLMTILPIALIFTIVCFCAPKFMISIFSNDPAVQEVGSQYLKVACLCYVPLALNYLFGVMLRCTEEVRLPMVTSVFSSLANIVLNYGLIFGKLGMPEMGVTGAALASFISTAVNPLSLIVISLFQKNVVVSGGRELLALDREMVRHFWGRALPVLANESLWSLGTCGYYMVYGRMGTDHYAAVTIVNTIVQLSYVFYIGICNACNVMVGTRVGADQIEDAKGIAWRFMVLVPVLGLILGGLLIALAHPILSFFDASESVKTTAFWLLVMLGVGMGIQNTPYMAVCGIFRAGGDTKAGMRYDLITLYGIGLPLVVVLGLLVKAPFLLVYASYLVGESWVKTVMCWRRFASMKWIMPVTSPKETMSET